MRETIRYYWQSGLIGMWIAGALFGFGIGVMIRRPAANTP